MEREIERGENQPLPLGDWVAARTVLGKPKGNRK